MDLGASARPAPAPPARPEPRDETVPLTASLSRLHVTVSRQFLAKLDAARDALSHSHRGASIEQILEVGLDLVIERSAKRKGLVKKPLKNPRPSSGDDIPAHVKRAVWIRDGGRCQWPLASGGICGSTCRVQFHHREERALGGPPTIKNVQILCDVHNPLASRLTFGDEWMDQFTNKGGRNGGPPCAKEPVAAWSTLRAAVPPPTRCRAWGRAPARTPPADAPSQGRRPRSGFSRAQGLEGPPPGC